MQIWTPLNPLTHLRETFIDTAFRASQYKMLNKDRLKCCNPSTINAIIEGRIRTEKYLEKKNGNKTNKWELIT